MLITRKQTTKIKKPKPTAINALKASFALSSLPEDTYPPCCFLQALYNRQHAFVYRSSKQNKIKNDIIKKVDPVLRKFHVYTMFLTRLLIFIFSCRSTSTNINYDTTSWHAFRISVGILG